MLDVVFDDEAKGYALALSQRLEQRGVRSRALSPGKRPSRDGCALLLDLAPTTSPTLLELAGTIQDGQAAIVVALGSRQSLLPGVEPLSESTAAVASATPSDEVLARLLEVTNFLRVQAQQRRRARGYLFAVGLGGCLFAGFLALATSAGRRSSELELKAEQGERAAKGVEAQIAQATVAEQNALSRANAARELAERATAQSASFASQVEGVRNFLRPSPNLAPGAYDPDVRFIKSEGHVGWKNGKYWRHYKLTPNVATLTGLKGQLAYTFYHAVGRCSSHLLQASTKPKPDAFEYTGWACYQDVRALFVSSNGGPVVAARGSVCPPDAKAIFCP